MRAKVRYSTYSIILTVIALAVLVAACVITDNNMTFYILFSVTFLLLFFAAQNAPIRIDADPEKVSVRSLTRGHDIKLRDIESVELFQPTMGTYRLCGSGGFMGYWGIFREGDVGKYTAFYGRSSDCFMIRLKNGDKYVLGCQNPSQLVDYLRAHLPR